MAVNYNILNEIKKRTSIDNLYYFVYSSSVDPSIEEFKDLKQIFFRADSEEEAYRKVYDYSEEIRQGYYWQIEDDYRGYFKDDEEFNYEELKKRVKVINFDKEEIEYLKYMNYNESYMFYMRKVEMTEL